MFVFINFAILLLSLPQHSSLCALDNTGMFLKSFQADAVFLKVIRLEINMHLPPHPVAPKFWM